jgi:serine/threonine protein phosphatase PrpC
MIDDAAIARTLAWHDDPREAAEQLLGEALDRGGKDNVTVIVARYAVSPGGRRSPAAPGTAFESTSDSLPRLPGFSSP